MAGASELATGPLSVHPAHPAPGCRREVYLQGFKIPQALCKPGRPAEGRASVSAGLVSDYHIRSYHQDFQVRTGS